jgi:hypothetical protein
MNDKYHGVEIALDPGSMDIHHIRRRCADFGLELIALHGYATGASPLSLLDDYTDKLERILETRPLLWDVNLFIKDYLVRELQYETA